jgi:hypothetical protein
MVGLVDWPVDREKTRLHRIHCAWRSAGLVLCDEREGRRAGRDGRCRRGRWGGHRGWVVESWSASPRDERVADG